MANGAVAMAAAMEGMDTAAAAHLVMEDYGPMDSTEELLEMLRLLNASFCGSLTVSKALHMKVYSPKSIQSSLNPQEWDGERGVGFKFFILPWLIKII